MRILVSTCLALVIAATASSQTTTPGSLYLARLVEQVCYAFPLNANLWSDPASWTGGVPGAGQVAHIPPGTTIYLDQDTASLEGIEVQGTLIFLCKDLDVTADWIRVTGRLEVGTPGHRFQRKAVITLTELHADAPNAPGNKVLTVEGQGQLVMHGDNHGPSWLRLAQTAPANQDQLVLEAAPNWNVNDHIVVASTDYDMLQAEEFTISAINGTTITVDQDLSVPHWGATEGPAPGVREYAEVGLLTRNIVVQGSPTVGQSPHLPGHVIFRDATGAGLTINLTWVEFRDLGNEGMLGQYPVHFHQLGTAVTGYVRNCSLHHSSNRGFVIHGTQGIELEDNVAYDTIGHTYYLEDGSEVDNDLIHNLGLVTRAATFQVGSEDTDIVKPSTFWISNNDNVIDSNAAAGSDEFGFWMGEPNLSPTPTKFFKHNVAHSNFDTGFYQNTRPMPTPSNPTIWEDLTTYKNRRQGIWFRSYGVSELVDIKAADNRSGFYVASTGTPAGLPMPTLTTTRNSLVVGVTDNLGVPSTQLELHHGRSLPQDTPWAPGIPPLQALVGYEVYDGPVLVLDTHFVNFEDFDYTSTNPLWQRKAGALHQVLAQDSPWAMDPTNAVSGLTFEQPGTRSVYLRDALPGATGIAMTTILDLDGSVTGTAGSYVLANTDLLVPPFSTAANFDSDWNAYVLPPSAGYVYGQLDFRNTDALNQPEPVTIVNLNEQAKSFDSTAPVVSTQHHTVSVPINSASPAADDIYAIQYPVGTTAPTSFRLTLRDTAPNESILVVIPIGSIPSNVTHNGSTIGFIPLNAFLNSSGNAWTVSQGQFVFRLVTGGSGSTVFDGLPTEFEVFP